MKKKRQGLVRIIGGKWRGRRLPVPDLPGLRPSGDRCRETLFNWLQADIRGSRCVDLFAGTGVLGLEAASRGAAQVLLLEISRVAATVIRSNIELLDATNADLIETNAITWLKSCDEQSMDIVFVDPPFGMGLKLDTIELLQQRNCLRPGGLVYLETARDADFVLPDSGWEVAKEKVLGEVQMLLLEKN